MKNQDSRRRCCSFFGPLRVDPHLVCTLSLYAGCPPLPPLAPLPQARLGVCPQHDMLLELLTVEEHLQLFASLKGLTPARARQQSRCCDGCRGGTGNEGSRAGAAAAGAGGDGG